MNHYEFLGVNQDASFSEIQKAYKKLAKKFHPDPNGGDPYFAEHFKRLHDIYDVLSNESTRKKYDAQLNSEIRQKWEIEETKRKLNEKERELNIRQEMLKNQKQNSILKPKYSYSSQPIQKRSRPQVDWLVFWDRAVKIMQFIFISLLLTLLVIHNPKNTIKEESIPKKQKKKADSSLEKSKNNDASDQREEKIDTTILEFNQLPEKIQADTEIQVIDSNIIY